MKQSEQSGWDYAQQVIEGTKPAAHWLKQACKRAIDDKTTAEARGYYYDANAADKVIKFFSFLKHLKGPLAGKTFELADWQLFIIGQIYGWKRTADNQRRFRTVYIEVPRKSGKSTLCSGLALYHLIADGESAAEVYAAAVTRDQARIVFGDAQVMVKRNETLSKHLKPHRSVILHDNSGSKFEPLSSDAGSLEGRNPSFSIVDEMHVHKSPEIWDVLNIASGARAQPIIFAITTAGTNQEGICYEIRDYVTKILDRQVEDDTFFSAIWTIDEGDDWRTVEAWQKANPNYGVSVFPDDLERLAKQAMESPSGETNFRTKRLNTWMNSSQAWIGSHDWQKNTKERPPIESWKGQPCYVGLDLASVSDFASMCVLFQKDGVIYPYIQHYLPEDTVKQTSGQLGIKYDTWVKEKYITLTEGNVTDLSYIQNDLEKVMGDYDVREIAYDPYGASQLTANLLEKGAPMVKMSQGIMSMSDPSKELEKHILSGDIAHGNDPVLGWMISNCVLYIDPNDNIKIKKEMNKNKIDGVIALVMALGRMKVNGGLETSVYEKRGMRAF